METLFQESFLLQWEAVVVSLVSLHPELEVDLVETELISANFSEIDKKNRF